MTICPSPFHDCEAEAPVEVQERRPTPQEEPQRRAETWVSFDREVDKSHMRIILSTFIRSVNWDEYIEEAIFWVTRGHSALARQTINVEIYQSVSNYMESLGIDLEGTLHQYIERQEVPEEYSESEVSMILQTLIGIVEFAISLGPSIHKEFDKPDAFGIHNRATEDIRSSRANQGPAAALEAKPSTSSHITSEPPPWNSQ